MPYGDAPGQTAYRPSLTRCQPWLRAQGVQALGGHVRAGQHPPAGGVGDRFRADGGARHRGVPLRGGPHVLRHCAQRRGEQGRALPWVRMPGESPIIARGVAAALAPYWPSLWVQEWVAEGSACKDILLFSLKHLWLLACSTISQHYIHCLFRCLAARRSSGSPSTAATTSGTCSKS